MKNSVHHDRDRIQFGRVDLKNDRKKSCVSRQPLRNGFQFTLVVAGDSIRIGSERKLGNEKQRKKRFGKGVSFFLSLFLSLFLSFSLSFLRHPPFEKGSADALGPTGSQQQWPWVLIYSEEITQNYLGFFLFSFFFHSFLASFDRGGKRRRRRRRRSATAACCTVSVVRCVLFFPLAVSFSEAEGKDCNLGSGNWRLKQINVSSLVVRQGRPSMPPSLSLSLSLSLFVAADGPAPATTRVRSPFGAAAGSPRIGFSIAVRTADATATARRTKKARQGNQRRRVSLEKQKTKERKKDEATNERESNRRPVDADKSRKGASIELSESSEAESNKAAASRERQTPINRNGPIPSNNSENEA